MKMLKRIVCFALASLLLISVPITAYAAIPAAPPTVAEYVFDLLLSSKGVDAGLQAGTSWLGSWSGYDDYLEKGKSGQLGAYSQYLWDIQNSDKTQEFKDSARKQIEIITGWMDMDWTLDGGKDIPISTVLDGSVDGIPGSVADVATSVKGFLSSFSAYGTTSTHYAKKYNWSEITVNDLTKPANYGNLFFSYKGAVNNNGYAYYYNYYYVKDFSPNHKPFGYLGNYHADTGQWDVFFNYISGEAPTIGKRYSFTIKNWTYTYHPATGVVGRQVKNDLIGTSGIKLSSYLIQKLPIPVFANKSAADAYATSATLENLYNQTGQGLPVVSVNQEAQTTAVKVPPVVITLPQTGEQAAQLQDELDAAMDRIEKLEVALKNAGLDIGWDIEVVEPTVAPTVVPSESAGEGTDTETKTTLAAILAKVEAIPATIEAMLDKKLEPDDSIGDAESMQLPTSIADKFPFCIPFDLAYLVKSMNASSEVPRFELPFKIHYLGFNYEQTFIVDMSDWDTAVKILRTMLDLLFIAGLISVTRDLIRG